MRKSGQGNFIFTIIVVFDQVPPGPDPTTLIGDFSADEEYKPEGSVWRGKVEWSGGGSGVEGVSE